MGGRFSLLQEGQRGGRKPPLLTSSHVRTTEGSAGGDPGLAMQGRWDEWSESAEGHPTVTSYQLGKISDLLNPYLEGDRHAQLEAAVDRAIETIEKEAYDLEVALLGGGGLAHDVQPPSAPPPPPECEGGCAFFVFIYICLCSLAGVGAGVLCEWMNVPSRAPAPPPEPQRRGRRSFW